MPPFFISLIYALLSGFLAIAGGYAIKNKDYPMACLWLSMCEAIIIGGALHVHRHFMGFA